VLVRKRIMFPNDTGVKMSRVPYHYLVIGLLTLGCRSDEEAQAASSSIASVDSSKNSTPDVAKVPRDTSPTDRMTRMQSVVDSASLPTIQAMVATHPQMVDSMVNNMNAEMKRMNMTPSAEWTALCDSVMKDLDRLGTVSTTELVAAFRDHHARMMRLVRMHQSMMGRPPAG
jgi:hypothetical protein